MRSRWFGILSMLILAGLVLSACARQTSPAQTLRVNLSSYPETLDPQKAFYGNEIAHLRLIYEGLTRLDATLQTVPGAAEKWEYNADATELTFTLRGDLHYSDGSLLNARRFEYALLRSIDPMTGGDYTAVTDLISGAAEWRNADLTRTTPEQLAALKAAVKVKALDRKGIPCSSYDQSDCLVLKIGFKQPTPFFHTVMSLSLAYPAKEELIKAGGLAWYTDPRYQVGNGPMVLSDLKTNETTFFTPNPSYWRGTAAVNIEFHYISDEAASFKEYQSGALDILPLGAANLSTVKGDAALNAEYLSYPGSCTFALMFHQQKEPFSDPLVREAFAYALDRQTWVKEVLKGLGSPTLTWIPPGFPGYDPTETRWDYDPAKARAALEASSYGSVENLPEITLTFSDSPQSRTRFQWLAAKYKAVLGVDLKLNPVEPTTFTTLTKDLNTAPQIYLLGWCADYPDPQNWLSVYWKTGGFGAKIGYSNPQLDALLNEADATLEPAKRMALYAEAQKLLTDTIPVAYFWNNLNSFLVKPYVKGITVTPLDYGWPGEIDPLSIRIEK